MEDEEERQVFALITRTLERSRREENVKEVGGLREYLRGICGKDGRGRPLFIARLDTG